MSPSSLIIAFGATLSTGLLLVVFTDCFVMGASFFKFEYNKLGLSIDDGLSLVVLLALLILLEPTPLLVDDEIDEKLTELLLVLTFGVVLFMMGTLVVFVITSIDDEDKFDVSANESSPLLCFKDSLAIFGSFLFDDIDLGDDCDDDGNDKLVFSTLLHTV